MSYTPTPDATLLPFSFANLPVRGRLLRMAGLATHVPSLADAPPHLHQSLSELITLAALLTSESRKTPGGAMGATLQVQHPGFGALMFAHCSPEGVLKAYANPAATEVPFPQFAALAQGQSGIFAVTLESSTTGQRFQSLIPLTHPSIRRCVEAYYNEAVQTPTLLRVFSDSQGCGALFLQKLPDQNTDAEADDWHRLTLLLETLKAEEILPGGTDSLTLIHQLFAEDDVEIYPEEPLSFQADNPRPRMLAALASIPPDELQSLLENGPLTLVDETSGREETFTEAELSAFLTVNHS